MLPTGDFMNQRYSVYDKENRWATSYNLGFGKALALRWAKIACDQLEGKVTLVSDGEPRQEKVVYQKPKKKK